MAVHQRYQELAAKWLNGTISDAEKEEFAQWYQSHADESLELPESFAGSEAELKERIHMNICKEIHRSNIRRIGHWPSLRRVAAAAILVVSVGGLWYYLTRTETPANTPVQVAVTDVQPGSNRATLSLSDGSTIDLNPDKNGIVVGSDIKYQDGAVVAGTSGVTPGEGKTAFQTVSTPRGGQYQVELPDGSKVWLNAITALRYPVRFSENSREVELLSGEAYFDIQPKSSGGKKLPFIVKSNGQEVQVLGTQFNINTYGDDDQQSVATTLVEGSVRVNPATGIPKTLTPGKQAINNARGIQVKDVVTEEYTGWKDGYFYFNNADIRMVLNQFTRWYDIRVRYEMDSTNGAYVGKIPRNVSLVTALKVLKSAGVYFELQDGNVLLVKDKP